MVYLLNKKNWGGEDIVINGIVFESEPTFECSMRGIIFCKCICL